MKLFDFLRLKLRLVIFSALVFFIFDQKMAAQCAPNFGEECGTACFWPGSGFDIYQLSNAQSLPSTFPNWCGAIENDLWFIVTPTASTTTITVTPGSCVNGEGLQIGLYEVCGGPFLDCNVGCSSCGNVAQSITAHNLVPGAPYFLIVDGYAGDICDFTISASPMLGETLGYTLYMVEGHVWLDADGNCAFDSTDAPAAWFPLEMTDGTTTLHSYSNHNGFYRFWTSDAGNYTIEADQPSLPFSVFSFCPNPQTATVGPTNSTATLDFFAQQDSACSFVAGQIALPWLRPCQKRQLSFQYQNFGFAVSEDATAIIRLDPVFLIDSIVPPPTATSGDTLFFDLGDLGPMQSGAINIFGQLPCDTSIVGDALCAEFWLPGTICDTVGNTSNTALLRPRAECLGNGQARFVVKNVGNAATTVPNEYIIIEDEVVMKTGTISTGFGAGAEMEILTAADGSGLRFEVSQKQQPLAAAGFESVFLKNCGGQTEQFFANQWPLGSGEPWHDVECRTIVLSCDPNQKSAQPMGYGLENYVRPNEDIEYLVEFQNTGTDTAFFVEIIDTLDANFDPATLRILGHSHPMDFSFSGQNTLKFTFKNIVLTDTATNWQQSQGFVKFKAGQLPNLPDHTVLRNRAGIVFDINAPVWTNATRHTVCRRCHLLVSVDEPKNGQKGLAVVAQPNPFSEKTTLEIDGAPDGEMLFKLVDLTGRTVFSAFFEGKKLELSSDGLAGGAYFFSIEKNGERLATGKIFVQR